MFERPVSRAVCVNGHPLAALYEEARKWAGTDSDLRKKVLKNQLFTESYCTAAQFEYVEQGFDRNCGPAAITNLCIALGAERRLHLPVDHSRLMQDISGLYYSPDEAAEKIYMAVAMLGERKLYYINADIFHRFGGTSDLLVPRYIRAALRMFGLGNGICGRRKRTLEDRLTEALSRGSIVYIELHHHPLYGDHHILVYGIEEDGDRKAFRTADGWHHRPTELTMQDLAGSHMVEVEVRPRGRLDGS